MTELPDWLRLIFARALLGEIYPAIRAIALKYHHHEKRLLVHVYFDREPDADDIENIEVILTNVSSMTNRAEIATADLECIGPNDSSGVVDPLDGCVFLRAEIEPGIPYLQGPQ